MKKRMMMVLVSVCVAGLLALTGCGSSGDAQTADNAAAPDDGAAGEDSSASGYVFEANGVTIAPDADMAPIAEALGEPSSYFEEPSCAAQGIAKLYTYSGFEVDTYPDGDNDLVASIILKDDTVATPEGVDLSKTRADVIAAYGEDYEDNNGSMVYEKGGMKLCFIMDGDNIAAIEYNSSVLD